jgi:hypothetical protein
MAKLDTQDFEGHEKRLTKASIVGQLDHNETMIVQSDGSNFALLVVFCKKNEHGK